MLLQDTDLFVVSKDGTNYKISAIDLKSNIKEYDYLVVSRGGQNYKLAKQNLSPLLSDDYLIVNRSSVNYKVIGSSFNSYIF